MAAQSLSLTNPLNPFWLNMINKKLVFILAIPDLKTIIFKLVMDEKRVVIQCHDDQNFSQSRH